MHRELPYCLAPYKHYISLNTLQQRLAAMTNRCCLNSIAPVN
ncbi:hypothetical protein [Lacrimispora sp.]